MKNLDLSRSKYARQKILGFAKDKNEESQRKFRSYIRNTPANILAVGLINTMVFMKSKSSENPNYEEILKIFNEWIGHKNRNLIGDASDIIEYGLNNSDNFIDVLYITDEVMALCGWLKRFSEIHLANKRQEVQSDEHTG